MSVQDDPGGSSLQVSNFVTIPSTRSDMETEGSIIDTDCSENNKFPTKRRRTSSRKCKHCNKKRSTKNLSFSGNDCDCPSTSKNSLSMPPPSITHSTDSNVKQNSSRIFYQASDAAPYVVHVQRESQLNENTSIHPVTLGFFLKKHNFKNIVNGSLKKIGRNRVSLSFSKFEDANAFVENGLLKASHYKAFIPSFNITRMGVVRGVPIDWSEEEILKNLSVPIGSGNIIKVRRLNRKTIINEKREFVPIETVVLTFDGQVLPPRVFLFYNALPVNLYIYPTIQCFNCCRYGHIKGQCRSSPRCFKCGLGHTGDSCSADEESVTCCLCSGSHHATSKNCPEFSRQKNIKESMAKSCISYSEALKLHPPINKLYSSVLSSSPNLASPQLNIVNPNPPVRRPPASLSYKKTVLLNKKVSHKPYHEYDHQAHRNLIKDYNMNLPSSGPAYIENTSLSDISVKELILTLINALNKTNLCFQPSNAAINNVSNSHSIIPSGQKVSGDSVELS